MPRLQKSKEKRQLGREVINFGPQTIGQTLASSTRSCFPNTIYSPESSHFHLLAHFLRISGILSIVILFRLKCISLGRSLSATWVPWRRAWRLVSLWRWIIQIKWQILQYLMWKIKVETTFSPDRHRGSTTVHLSRDLTAHGKTDQDLHERGNHHKHDKQE